MNEKALADFVDAWNAQDIDRVMSYFAPDATYQMRSSHTGHAAIREAIAAGFRNFPDGRIVQTSLFIAGDRAMAQWHFDFTDATGKPARIDGCDAFTFAGDRIKVKSVYMKQFVPTSVLKA